MRGTAHRRTTLDAARTSQVARAEEPGAIRIHVVLDSPELQERIVRGMGAVQNWEMVLEEPNRGRMERMGEKSTANRGRKVVLLSATGGLQKNLGRIQSWKGANQEIKVILLSDPIGDSDFLRYVRAGIRGFLSLDLSGTEIANAVRRVLEGGAVCESSQCAVLFRYFAQEAESFPSAALHRDLGLTRREQQLIPLLTRGLTNKEIANHFSLAEQTVKNHLYRMKRKIGAHGRLEIVDVCRQHGFLA